MFGTVFEMKPKSGAKQDVINEFERWRRERRGKVPGFVASYLLEQQNSENLTGIAVFEDEDSFRKNADDPEQDKWFQGLRQLLESDPVWKDGAVYD